MVNLLKEVKGNIYGLGVYCFKDADGIVRYTGSGMMNDRLQAHLFNFKRNLYEGTNKDILQKTYNYGELSFEVLHFSVNNEAYINGTAEERKAIQQSLEVLEQFYLDLYKDTCCNKVTKIRKWSTSPNVETTNKRRKANLGNNNPNVKYDEELICNVLFLKDIFKPKEIKEIIMQEFGIEISTHYISCLGNTKWKSVTGIKADWMDKYLNIA